MPLPKSTMVWSSSVPSPSSMDFSLREEAGELLHLVLLQLQQAVDVLLHLAVMRERVVILPQAEGRRLRSRRAISSVAMRVESVCSASAMRS